MNGVFPAARDWAATADSPASVVAGDGSGAAESGAMHDGVTDSGGSFFTVALPAVFGKDATAAATSAISRSAVQPSAHDSSPTNRVAAGRGARHTGVHAVSQQQTAYERLGAAMTGYAVESQAAAAAAVSDEDDDDDDDGEGLHDGGCAAGTKRWRSDPLAQLTRNQQLKPTRLARFNLSENTNLFAEAGPPYLHPSSECNTGSLAYAGFLLVVPAFTRRQCDCC